MGEDSNSLEGLLAEIERLRGENARLVALLDERSIRSRESAPEHPTGQPALSTADKVGLFRRLFRGRVDVFPVRWESKNGRSGYAPACANEWKPSVCEKPRVRCGECPNQAFLPLDDQSIYNHLAGKGVIGVYPLLPDDTCYFLTVDFDDSDWREDAGAFARSCRELEVPKLMARQALWLEPQETIDEGNYGDGR